MMHHNWLSDFQEKHGRPLRVLHLGNVANNAFYNSKFLNARGVHSDVLCGEFLHVMASPEWEEAEFTALPKDFYFPDWWNLDITGYDRPRWFAQGPWDLCVDYLLSRTTGDEGQAEKLWFALFHARQVVYRRRGIYNVARKLAVRIFPAPYFSKLKFIFETALYHSALAQFLPRALGKKDHIASSLPSQNGSGEGFASSPDRNDDSLVEEFKRMFPDRPDKLTKADTHMFRFKAESLRSLIPHYDIVHAYGTDVIYPMLLGCSPYVGFEHGTLRDVPHAPWRYKGPSYDNSMGRLTAMAYVKADHVFVTNADNVSNVKRLGIKNYSGIGHPFDEKVFLHQEEFKELLRSKVKVKYLFVCPIRHDWYEKGVDKYIAALPALREALGNSFKVLFMPWGNEVGRSKRFIAEIGCEDLIVWDGPFGQIWFSRWLSAADVIFDQLAFPSFSGTTPRALSSGIPVIVNYDHTAVGWMFQDPPPVLRANSVEDVVRQTMRALDLDFKKRYRVKAEVWIKKNHSAELTTNELLNTYNNLLEE